MLKRYFLWKTSLCGFTTFRKGIAQTYTMSSNILLSGYLVTIQLHKCAHFVFCIKNIHNFVDLDACKQLFVLNSYKSAIKKTGSQKNHKSIIFLERFKS